MGFDQREWEAAWEAATREGAKRFRPAATVRWHARRPVSFATAAALLVLMVTPVAIAASGDDGAGSPKAQAAAGEGLAVRAGERNPRRIADTLSSETQVVANNATYGTRQSNKSDNGGGAIYGCRSKAGGTATGNEPCVRANNLVDGLAFEFQATTGKLGGLIQFGGSPGTVVPDAQPFATNGGKTVDNLSADKVDGKDASAFMPGAAIRVRFAEAPIGDAGGNQASVEAQCGAGEVLIGGGGAVSAFDVQLHILASRPHTAGGAIPVDGETFNQWRVSVIREAAGVAGVTVRSWAICVS